MDPRAYHRTNLLLHAASAVCLFFVARQLLGIALRSSTNDRTATPLPAWQVGVAACFSALFWSIHPLRVESVAWITERRDCLSGLFFMLTLLAWLAHARSASLARGRWYWIALACFAASLLAKGLSMVLPLVMLVLDAWPLRRTEQILTGGAKR